VGGKWRGPFASVFSALPRIFPSPFPAGKRKKFTKLLTDPPGSPPDCPKKIEKKPPGPCPRVVFRGQVVFFWCGFFQPGTTNIVLRPREAFFAAPPCPPGPPHQKKKKKKTCWGETPPPPPPNSAGNPPLTAKFARCPVATRKTKKKPKKFFFFFFFPPPLCVFPLVPLETVSEHVFPPLPAPDLGARAFVSRRKTQLFRESARFVNNLFYRLFFPRLAVLFWF